MTLPQAARIALNVDGKISQLGVPEIADAYEPNAAVGELIDDLAFIETHLNVAFEFPEELPGALERVWIRVVRIMLSGGCAVMPDTSGFNVTLNGKPDIAESGLFGEGAALFVGNDEWTMELLGEEIFVGSMGVYHPNVGAGDAGAHLQALQAGKAAGRRVRFRPNDDTPFRIYSPARVRPDDEVVPSPGDCTASRSMPSSATCGVSKHRDPARKTSFRSKATAAASATVRAGDVSVAMQLTLAS